MSSTMQTPDGFSLQKCIDKGLINSNEYHYQNDRGECKLCHGELFINTSHICSMNQKEMIKSQPAAKKEEVKYKEAQDEEEEKDQVEQNESSLFDKVKVVKAVKPANDKGDSWELDSKEEVYQQSGSEDEKIKPQFKRPDNIKDQDMINISMEELTEIRGADGSYTSVSKSFKYSSNISVPEKQKRDKKTKAKKEEKKLKATHQTSGSAQEEIKKQAALYKGIAPEPRRSGRNNKSDE